MRQDINNHVLVRTAEEVKSYKVWRRLLSVIILMIIIILLLLYLASALYRTNGSFTVKINRLDYVNYKLTVSDSSSYFAVTSVKLDTRASKTVSDTCYSQVLLNLRDCEGIHNGDNFVACTFFIRNEGIKTLDYAYEMYIENVTKRLDQAARIYVQIDDGDPVIYSHWNSSKEPEYVCPFDFETMGLYGITKNFVSDQVIFFGSHEGLRPYREFGDLTKFTVVIWIEGDDNDCTDDKVDGVFRLSMLFSVIGIED